MKKLTKKEKFIINSYNLSNITSLHEAYERPSDEKRYIYNKYYQEFGNDPEAFGGFKIISFNGFMFTLGYIKLIDGVKYLRYITKSQDILIKYEDVKK